MSDGFILLTGVLVVVIIWQITGAQEKKWRGLSAPIPG